MNKQSGSSFTVVNLASQADGAAHYVEGWSKEKILDWLSRQGELKRLTDIYGNEYFNFNSRFGFDVNFYLDGDEFLFVGDHTSWKPKR
jgi:hypothetical protein